MNWDEIIADLEVDLNPDPAFFVEQTDKGRETEVQRVVAFRRAVRKLLPQAKVVAVPNGGKRGQKAINQAKAEGAVWGWPDLMVLAQKRIAFFEFKNGTRQPSDHQILHCNWLRAQGFDVACVRTADGAIERLEEWGWFDELP